MSVSVPVAAILGANPVAWLVMVSSFTAEAVWVKAMSSLPLASAMSTPASSSRLAFTSTVVPSAEMESKAIYNTDLNKAIANDTANVGFNKMMLDGHQVVDVPYSSLLPLCLF